MRLASLAAAVRHDRPDPSVTAGRAGTCHDAVRVGAMAETILAARYDSASPLARYLAPGSVKSILAYASAE
jgi:hypothetical protein